MDSATTVVLRYRDGRTERASLVETDVDMQIVRVIRDGGAKDEVPFSTLKALFFPQTAADGTLEEPAGSTIAVEFADGETIRGVAQYNPERNGFFLFPLDRSKNDRIFVVNSAIVSIEVEKL
ncbi:MAG: hypothetical protein QOK37_4442 [Thermoanaerobaculia bacterium]|jgi:hypothetical protein|nr:hypothetical protein [Thermoanaerobaculia bacterium]